MMSAYFGLKRLPFGKEIKSEQMFETFDTREAFTRLGYVRQNRGIIMLTGEPGAGKTSVLRRFVDGLNPQNHQHCYTPHVTISRSELYRQLNLLLRLPPRIRKTDLFEQIQRSILDMYENSGKTPVIILDEMQMADHQTLQELVLITNFQMDSKVPFILVLIGQPEFRETLKRRIHEPLNQRITLRYHMAGLNADETPPFIRHALKIAGRADPIFEENSFEVIHQLSHGLPRKVGNLCMAAMTLAMTKKRQTVDADCVVQASAGI
jgi:general secretion pathway protein A